MRHRGPLEVTAAATFVAAVANVVAVGVAVGNLGCNGGSSGGPGAGAYRPPVEIRPLADASTGREPSPTDGPIAPDDTPRLAALLKDGRLPGWIHGAVHDRGLYVFTYREPDDFFSFAEFPLTPATAEVTTQLLRLKRHDAVLVKGTFIENGAPIRHIRAENVSLVTSYQSDETAPPRTAETSFPEALVGQTEAIAKVHAVDSDGRVLVIEYGDAVVPVFVRVPALTAGLYRNDKIRLAFEFAPAPPRPTHLWLDVASAHPLDVLERLVDRHGAPFEAEGLLVRYPISPQITVDVYALQVTDADGISRDYTLLNQSEAIFAAIRDKLGAAWRSRPGLAIDGRNKLVNPHIKVRARGTFNLIAPNQANAQILLDSADDLTITQLP